MCYTILIHALHQVLQCNTSYREMLADPSGTDFNRWSHQDKLNLFRKLQHCDDIIPGTTVKLMANQVHYTLYSLYSHCTLTMHSLYTVLTIHYTLYSLYTHCTLTIHGEPDFPAHTNRQDAEDSDAPLLGYRRPGDVEEDYHGTGSTLALIHPCTDPPLH
jgi:hypothetical protein